MMRHDRGMTLLTVMMLSSLLSSCASVPTASLKYQRMAAGFTSQPGMASVYVYRPYTPVGSAILITVGIDNQRLGTVGPNTYLFDNIKPGSHIINVYSGGRAKSGVTKFNAEEGRLYFFKVQHSSGWVDVWIDAEQVDEREGREKIISCKLSGDNLVDRALIIKLLSVDYVLIEHKEIAYTVFAGIPKEKIDAVRMKIQTEKEVDIIGWDEFMDNLDKYVKVKILKDDYPESRVVEGILDLLRKYSETPIGLTWNGGIAITANDYRHAEKTYKKYQDNPSEYEQTKIQDFRLDPVNPKNHLGPLLEP